MSDSRKKKEAPAPTPEEHRGGEEGGAGSIPTDGGGESEELRRRAAEMEDKWLRAVADLDNFRKRTARDRERDLWAARAGIALPLLDVLDDFDRALGEEGEGGDAFREGVEMIREKFAATLEGLGVKGFDSVGEPFDPERHHALQSLPAEEVPEGHVAAEIRRGYLSGDRVLRPALVAVAAPPAGGAGNVIHRESSNDE